MTRRLRFRTAARSTVLVVGAPRSGTTMVTSLLGAHPKVGMISEDHRLTFTRISGKPVVGNKLCIPTQVQFDRRATLPRRVLHAAIAKSLGDRRAHRIPWLQPHSHYSIEDYLEWPDLKVVGVLRDPEAMIRSCMVRAGTTAGQAIHRWQSAIHTLGRIADDERFDLALVDYDSIVAEPTVAARRLCDFLGVTFDAGMLAGVRHNPIYHGREGISRPPEHEVAEAVPVPSTGALETHRRLLDSRLV